MDNENGILELLSKILEEQQKIVQEQQEMRKEQQEMRKEQQEMKKEQREMRKEQEEMKKEQQETKEIVLRMEQEHGRKLDALFDGYSLNYDKNTTIESEIAQIKGRMDKLEFQMKFMCDSVKI